MTSTLHLQAGTSDGWFTIHSGDDLFDLECIAERLNGLIHWRVVRFIGGRFSTERPKVRILKQRPKHRPRP